MAQRPYPRWQEEADAAFPASAATAGGSSSYDEERSGPLGAIDEPPRHAAGRLHLVADQPHAAASAKPAKPEALPIPTWLVRFFYLLPIVLYVPDGIFNFYVYTDGAKPPDANPLLQVGFFFLWSFVSLGIVGMAYLLSMLAPWHWGQGHPIQAFFCALGILIATGITIWNSLAYRSTDFVSFKTDEWVSGLFPNLAAHHVSITMILVAIAPPFWGLFWAIVQPTRVGKSTAQLNESHAQKLLRTQQEAELKAAQAEANARIRAARIKGMAATAGTLREAVQRKAGEPAAATAATTAGAGLATASPLDDGDYYQSFSASQPSRSLARPLGGMSQDDPRFDPAQTAVLGLPEGPSPRSRRRAEQRGEAPVLVRSGKGAKSGLHRFDDDE